jgi:DNA-binding transcriptional LysR family regulator
MIVELRQLEYFVAVAQELHFGRAASRVHVAPSAMSEQIKQLEEVLGVQLLHRTTREVALTQAGRIFLAQARVVLMQVETAIELARVADSGSGSNDAPC